MKKLLSLVAVLGLLAPALAAQGQSAPPPAKPEQKPEQKTETKPAASPAGKWNVSVQTAQGGMESTLDMKLDGKKVTGTMASQMGETPIEGEFAEGKLKFSISVQTNSGSIQVVFTGAFKDDGSLAGTMEYGQGPMTWSATRAKG